jgi:hypothetical protein
MMCAPRFVCLGVVCVLTQTLMACSSIARSDALSPAGIIEPLAREAAAPAAPEALTRPPRRPLGKPMLTRGGLPERIKITAGSA